MKKEMQLLGFTIITLLLVSLFVGCIGGKKEEKGQAKSVGLPEDWKTYENKEWGFRIKYPADWGEVESSVVGEEECPGSWDRAFQVGYPCCLSIFVKKFKKNPPRLEEWVESDINAWKEEDERINKPIKEEARRRNITLPSWCGQGFKVEEIKHTTLDKEPAIFVLVTWRHLEGTWKFVRWYAIYQGKGYLFEFKLDPPEDYYTYKELIEEIASSFKFLEGK
jgi:hypothetical protein